MKKSSINVAGQIATSGMTTNEIYERLMESLPEGNGHWSGEKGNSRWIPDGDIVPQNKHYGNLNRKTWKEILAEYGCEEGIWFTNGDIDFAKTGVVKAKVKIPGGISTCFTEDDLEKGRRVRLYETCVTILAEQLGKRVSDIIAWVCANCFICHECSDLETVQFVPQEIHGNVAHFEWINILKQK